MAPAEARGTLGTAADEASQQRIARSALELWGLSDARLERVSVSENVTFRVRPPKEGDLVLRLHRPGYHTMAELESEPLWTRALNEAGVSAPVARLSRAGRSHHEVVDERSGMRRAVGIAEWVGGEAVSERLERASGSTALTSSFEELGRLAAAIHDQAENWTPPAGFERRALDADSLMGEAPWWGRFWDLPSTSAAVRGRMARIRADLHDRLTQLRLESDRTFSMIHADLHAGNLIAHGDSLHVIDFDDCGFGFHQYELAVALVRHREDPRYGDYRQALFGGYRSVRSISDEALDQVDLFELVRQLASIGWLRQRPELGRGDQLAGMVERALAHAEALGVGG